MTRIRPGGTLLLIVLALVSWNCQAQLYKWVDENGDVHFSDKAPEDKIKSSVVPGQPENQVQYPGSSKATARPIMRSYDKSVHRLLLPDARYLWKDDSRITQPVKIGIYHVGRACTTRGAIKAPDVFIRHNLLLPNEAELAFSIKRVIKGLDYEAEYADLSRLQNRLKNTGGLSLHAEITAMDFKACAPNISDSYRLKPVATIPAPRFTRSRVRLRVDWQLRGTLEQGILYQTATDGEYNGWSQSNSPHQAIGSALETAVFNLFSDQDFVALLTDGNAGAAGQSSSSSPARAEKKSSITDLLLRRSRGTQALVEINRLKVGSMQHYVAEGKWPGDMSLIGYRESMFYDSDTIASVSLKSDGSIVAELKRSFGDDKIISLKPEVKQGNAVRIHWYCTSNLDLPYLPHGCHNQ